MMLNAGAASSSMGWLQAIRELHELHFSFDWYSHALALSHRYGLEGDDELKVNAPGLPPRWFSGDVEAIEPERWVLVVSLNPNYSKDGTDLQWFNQQAFDSEGWWNHMRSHNRDWWYAPFFAPLVQVAVLALGEEEVQAGHRPEFATTRMVFLELCPYVSHRFWLPWETIDELSRTDTGFEIAATLRKILIEQGSPALVLVNGRSAMWDFERIYE